MATGFFQGMNQALPQGMSLGREMYKDAIAAKRQAEMDAAAEKQNAMAMERQGMLDQRYDSERLNKDYQFEREMKMKERELSQKGALANQGAADRVEAKKVAKRPGEVTVRNLSEGRLLPGELTNVEKLLKGNRNLFGPITGRAGSVNPYNEPAQAVNSQIKAAAQMIGRYMEGGVLRAEDLPKYAAMLPSLSDTPETAQNKINNVRSLLERKYNTDLDSLQQGGYDVSNFEKMQNQQADPRIEMAKQALQDPEATPEEKAQAQRLLGM